MNNRQRIQSILSDNLTLYSQILTEPSNPNCKYNLRASIKEAQRLNRQLTNEEFENFRIKE